MADLEQHVTARDLKSSFRGRVRAIGRRPSALAAILAVVSVTAVLAVSTLAARPPAPVGAAQYRWPVNSVLPILFVPTDWNVNSTTVRQDAAGISTAMTSIQKFYAQSDHGKTFRLNALQVVQANGRKEKYNIHWNGQNIYTTGVQIPPTGNLEAAVVGELYSRGFPTPPGQDQGGYSVLIFVKGAGGYAGGRAFAHAAGGWGILGDWCIDSLAGKLAQGTYWWSGQQRQTGAAAHELGHTFTLSHPDTYGWPMESSLVGIGWMSYPRVGLNDHDRRELASARAAFFR